MKPSTGRQLEKVKRMSHWAISVAAVALSLAAWSCASMPANQPGAKVGVVDPMKVLKETAAGKRAEESLNAFVKNRQALIELEEKELKRMEEDLVRQASVLSGNAKKEREEQFRRRVMEFQQKGGELNREIQEKQREVMEGFREKVEKVVAKVAQPLGMQVVIEKAKGGTMLYSDASLDLSAKVIEAFNKEMP
ncbi:MAG: OmpH family outer membrane protein [Nitrospirae bacterium]|nr:OmpH family outer membrane protein [Nitrospirota bacterium]